MAYSIGVDIGGTFTDCVVIDDEGQVHTGKAPSTPSDFSVGFFDAVEDAGSKLNLELEEFLRGAGTLVHATTAGTNAVTERKGASVGLLATRGHGDAILIMRGAGRTKGLEIDDLLFIPGTSKPDPIVPRSRIAEITERVDSRGHVVVELDEQELRAKVTQLIEGGVEAIAVAFMWSFMNPAHELRAREIIAEMAPEMFVSCSHEVAARMGEYGRTVASVMNCYIGPLMFRYTGEIVDRAGETGYERPVLFAQCTGGSVPVSSVRRTPLFTLDSGPVSGVVASTYLSELFDYPNIITADMGGTTFDVSVISENTATRRESTIINKYEMFLSSLDVESIGAGGGSIAWIDPASGTMKVGPRSAGADPGPLCYGLGGTEPTVTDADVVLGIINPDNFLGGRRQLDGDASRRGVEALGKELGLSMEETAAGIAQIVDNHMAEKMRRMTVFRGHDVRDFVVFAFGGAGPVHAGSFAPELGVKAVVVPLGDIASVLSAFGTVSSDILHVYDASVVLSAPFDAGELDAVFSPLEDRAREALADEGFSGDSVELSRSVFMKYGAQIYDTEVPLEGEDPAQIVEKFERLYEQRFGKDSGYAPAGIEVIRERVYAAARLPRPEIRQSTNGSARDGQQGEPTKREVWWAESGGYVSTPIYQGVSGLSEDPVDGPLIIELPDTTVPVRPGQRVAQDRFGNLIITFE
ncbi:MAG: N-methylhydantoinase [Solirubrobacteraceae bacterium]|jgi:N-methylhydantoinase A|nr:N-methylhydantoinase [Solirubrobacteraceae bacterium]